MATAHDITTAQEPPAPQRRAVHRLMDHHGEAQKLTREERIAELHQLDVNVVQSHGKDADIAAGFYLCSPRYRKGWLRRWRSGD